MDEKIDFNHLSFCFQGDTLSSIINFIDSLRKEEGWSFYSIAKEADYKGKSRGMLPSVYLRTNSRLPYRLIKTLCRISGKERRGELKKIFISDDVCIKHRHTRKLVSKECVIKELFDDFGDNKS